MRKFILFIKDLHLYKKEELLEAVRSFSKRQFIIFSLLLFISIVSFICILGKVNSKFTVNVPVSGGSITEGILGVPTLINPVIALSDADKDLTMLVYSGLVRETTEGEFIADLAENYTVSEDGKIYTFVIKNNAKFHDGSKVTADDVLFTIEKIKDPLIKSPRRSSWAGIEVKKIDERTVVFTLDKPFISFMDNATIGILPSKLWKNVNVNEFNLSSLNIKAIGSGPYKIDNVVKDKEGIPEIYELKRFNNFALSKPLIKNIKIISYSNEKELMKALYSSSVDQAGGISSEYIKSLENKGYKINETSLPREFGLFINSNNNKIFTDATVMKAINSAIDRQDIINQILNGYGSVIYSPIPEKFLYDNEQNNYNSDTIKNVNEILEKSGWVMGEDGIRSKGGQTSKVVTTKVKGKTVKKTVKTNEPLVRLSFSITTGDTPELKKINNLIKEQLAKVGIEVITQKVYESGQLNQIIRARDYEALLFGQLINYESDIYSYWHSSQRLDPGLNIGMYNNKKVDLILESIQKIISKEERLSKYEDLEEEFDKNLPAILIYSPKYLYATSKNLNIPYLNITVPSDRFSSVYLWSTDTDKVWKIFNK